MTDTTATSKLELINGAVFEPYGDSFPYDINSTLNSIEKQCTQKGSNLENDERHTLLLKSITLVISH